MSREDRIARSATLQSIVRSGNRMRELGGISEPTMKEEVMVDSVPERTAMRRAEQSVARRSTFDDLVETTEAHRRQDARAVSYQREVQRVAHIRRATDNQKKYISDLLKRMESHNPQVWEEAESWYVKKQLTLSFKTAHQTIQRLLYYLNRPKPLMEKDLKQEIRESSARPAFDPYDDVPDGRYAIQEPREDKLHFYRVTRWKDSKRIKVQEQASDTLYPVHGWTQAKLVLDAIRKNPRAAAELYADELGQCYYCGRTLTDEESRAARVGPICRDKVSW
jgi:hypothetical protein